MHKILAILAALSSVQLTSATRQDADIPYEQAVDAIRRFRRDALGDAQTPVALNFCSIKEAFDQTGSLRQSRQFSNAPLSKRVDCGAECVATTLPVVCFTSARKENGAFVFPAFRLLPSGARIGEEYTVVPGTNPSVLHW